MEIHYAAVVHTYNPTRTWKFTTLQWSIRIILPEHGNSLRCSGPYVQSYQHMEIHFAAVVHTYNPTRTWKFTTLQWSIRIILPEHGTDFCVLVLASSNLGNFCNHRCWKSSSDWPWDPRILGAITRSKLSENATLDISPQLAYLSRSV